MLQESFTFTYEIVIFLEKLYKKLRFCSTLEFEFIFPHQVKKVNIIDLFDYFYIYKEFDHWTPINITKKYFIFDNILHEKNVCFFLWQLKNMVETFKLGYYDISFNNIFLYKKYINEIGFDHDYKLYFGKSFP